MRKIILLVLLLVSSLANVTAADLDPIAQTKALLDQYSARVKYLEIENAILREEMRKAKIQIPLSLFSWAIQTETSSITPVTPTPIVVSTGSITPVGPTTPVAPVTASGAISVATIEKNHGASYAGFIKRIISEWDKVRDAYAMPKWARIGGYEFVQSGALDNVFVDIIYTGSVSGTGIFDAKILYQFDRTTYARKLIWFFEYNTTTGYYMTKTGKNIFPWVRRTWVDDPRIVTPVVSATIGTNNSTPVTPTTNTTPVTYADIDAAYGAKRYLTTISLSNNWLMANIPTLDVLRIRYRTYFIIAKYSEALAEIEKIKGINKLSAAVACEGYVIATYAKNTSAADGYKAICSKK